MTWPVIIAVGATVLVLGLGGLLTRIGEWYALSKPRWQPPDWLFGPAWTVIGALTAWSAVLAWGATPEPRGRAVLVGLFALNGVLNVAWSVLFFTWRRPDWALGEVVLLWLSVAALIADEAPRAPPASWLLIPYLAWVSFAACLNLAIVRRNAPFGTSRAEPS